MPNAAAFYRDDAKPLKSTLEEGSLLKDCRAAPKVIGRAVSVDVTPDGNAGPVD
jgi:cytochrome c